MFKNFSSVNDALRKYDSTNLEMAQYVATLLSLPSTVVQQAKSLAAEYAALYNQISMVQYDSDNNIVDVTDKFDGRLTVPDSHIASVVQTIGETNSKIDAYVKLLNKFTTNVRDVKQALVAPGLWDFSGKLVNCNIDTSGVKFTRSGTSTITHGATASTALNTNNLNLVSMTPPRFTDNNVVVTAANFVVTGAGAPSYFTLCDINLPKTWSGSNPNKVAYASAKAVEFGGSTPTMDTYYEWTKTYSSIAAKFYGQDPGPLTGMRSLVIAVLALGVTHRDNMLAVSTVTNIELMPTPVANITEDVTPVSVAFGDLIKSIMPSTTAIEQAIIAL